MIRKNFLETIIEDGPLVKATRQPQLMFVPAKTPRFDEKRDGIWNEHEKRKSNKNKGDQ